MKTVPRETETLAAAWSPGAKRIASLLVSLHLLAVFLAPLWFASGEQSPAIAPLMRVFRPYIEAMFLNHGYAFFAPDPGSSYLVEYELEFDNGRPRETGRFPSIKEHWPRLLYHRHFMLSESYNRYANMIPPPPASDASPRERQFYERRREQYQKLQASITKHLEATHHASQARLYRIEHRPLVPNEVMELRWRLEQEETYRNLDLPQQPQTEEVPLMLRPAAEGAPP